MGKKLEKQIEHQKFTNWFENIAGSVLFVLHDKQGFGSKRLTRFMNDWTTLWNDIKDNCLSCEDIKKTLKNECGIDVKKFV